MTRRPPTAPPDVTTGTDIRSQGYRLIEGAARRLTWGEWGRLRTMESFIRAYAYAWSQDIMAQRCADLVGCPVRKDITLIITPLWDGRP